MKLYGKNGRTFRSLWMLEESGLTYDRELVDFSTGATLEPNYLALNPNGKIPVLQDVIDGQEVFVFDSLAINYHLAKTYVPQLWVQGALGEMLATQWLAWALGEMEGPHDAANRSKTKVDPVRLQRSLNLLRRRLTDQPYILGQEFSVLDLNVACMALRPQYQPVVEADAALGEWFERCKQRPALTRAYQLMT